MPTISQFHGVAIRMFYNEHGPPHFHGPYGEMSVSVDFDGRVLRGALPPHAMRLVREWTRLHRSELLPNWDLARAGRPLVAIEPLD